MTIEALRRHAPFDRMDEDALGFLAGALSLAYHAKGRRVAGPEAGPARLLHIVSRGRISGEASDGAMLGLDAVELGEGECVSLAEVVGERSDARVRSRGGHVLQRCDRRRGGRACAPQPGLPALLRWQLLLALQSSALERGLTRVQDLLANACSAECTTPRRPR